MKKAEKYSIKRKHEDEISYALTAWILDAIWHIVLIPFHLWKHFFFKDTKSFSIPESARERHTFVSGQTGSGKTEVLKNLIYHDIESGEKSVIVIDPHGDLADDVARFAINFPGDRLVFLDPRLTPGMTPCFNPFDIPDKYRTPEMVDSISDNLAETFVEMLKTAGLTVQMRSLLKPILTTLLLRPGSNILDVLKFFDHTQNAELIEFASQNLSNIGQIDFLRRDFHGENYTTSKAGISARIRALTNSLTFYDTMIGPATVRIPELMDERKITVVRLSGGLIGQDTAETLARFILASVKNAALFRQSMHERERVPCHIYLDEGQLFVTESIDRVLNETRKYRLHLTLAQQIPGWGMESDTKRALFANTGVKITGNNSADVLAHMAKETGAELEQLQSLGIGKFHVKSLSRPGEIVQFSNHLADEEKKMTQEQWEYVKNEQIKKYYRPSPRNIPGNDKPDSTAASVQAMEKDKPRRASRKKSFEKAPSTPAFPIPSDNE